MHIFTREGFFGRNKIAGTPSAPIILIALLWLAGACGQAHAQAKKGKGPLYQDEVLVVYKNLLQLRAPVGFYVYNGFQDTYKETQFPILIGGRYERLIKTRVGMGVEFELNQYTPFPPNLSSKRRNEYPNNQKPDQESVFKITPNARLYLRNEENKKNIFNGAFIGFGPSLITVQQVVDQPRTFREQKPNNGPPNPRGRTYYSPTTTFGISTQLGYSHMFKSGLTVSTSVEGLFSGVNFQQAGFTTIEIGSGSLQINPFRFYIGYRF